MLSIKLVRHAQSAANVGQVNSWEAGDHAIELTPEGHGQAAAAGQAIGQDYLGGALIYTSPFRRARQTLDGILKGAGLDRTEVQVYEDPRLREVDHGYTNVPMQRELQETHGRFYYRFAGGESPADCYDRTSGFLEGLMRQVQRKGAEHVLIVTHGLTIRCFVMRYLHLSVEQFDTMANPGNCDVITIAPIASVDAPVITIAPIASVDAPVFATSRWAVSGLRLNEPGTAVSRESARTIAGREIVSRGLGTGVSAVCSHDEVERLPSLYGAPDLTRCWLVYADRSGLESTGRSLRSAALVLVDRSSGAVVYAGSANDEG